MMSGAVSDRHGFRADIAVANMLFKGLPVPGSAVGARARFEVDSLGAC